MPAFEFITDLSKLRITEVADAANSREPGVGDVLARLAQLCLVTGVAASILCQVEEHDTESALLRSLQALLNVLEVTPDELKPYLLAMQADTAAFKRGEIR